MLKFSRSSYFFIVITLFPASVAFAFTATITPGTRAIYLQVGNGSFTGLYNSGGTPGNNTTVNLVSVTVPAAQVGNGVAQAMTTNSTATASFLDGFAFCTVPAQVYIGGFFRLPGATGTAGLTVNTPSTLTTTGDSIPFTKISWTSSGNGDTGVQPIPAGSFTGGTQMLASFPVNTWRESCHAFSYLNDQVVGSGTYVGRATYTLSAP
jgi:hypothetical protein